MLYGILLTVALSSNATATPGVKLPLLVINADFNHVAPGQTPLGPDKKRYEALLNDPWHAVPLVTYSTLRYTTRTRRATVEREALGLKDKPVLFVMDENNQPHYGPQMCFEIPGPIADKGKRWHVSVECSLSGHIKTGGFHLWDVAGIEFDEYGAIQMGNVELGRYKPATPFRIDVEIDVAKKTVTAWIDGHREDAVTAAWQRPRARRFGSIRLQGLLPGGHAWPGKIAWDNLDVRLLETLP